MSDKKNNVLLHKFESSKNLPSLLFKREKSLTGKDYCNILDCCIYWGKYAHKTRDYRFLNAAFKISTSVKDIFDLTHKICDENIIIKNEKIIRQLDDYLYDSKNFIKGFGVTHNNFFPLHINNSINNKNSLPKILILTGDSSTTFQYFLQKTYDQSIKIDTVIQIKKNVFKDKINIESNGAWHPKSTEEENIRYTFDYSHIKTFLKNKKLENNELKEYIKKQAYDFGILIGMDIIGNDIISLTKNGFINAHNGILPYYRGMDSVGWAMFNNDIVGCTLHRVEPGVDTGNIFSTNIFNKHEKISKKSVKLMQVNLLIDFIRFYQRTTEFPKEYRNFFYKGKLFYRLHPKIREFLSFQ